VNNPEQREAGRQEIITRLAHFMGWEKGGAGDAYCWHTDEEHGTVWQEDSNWNPEIDWNDWRILEEKMMEDKGLRQDFLEKIFEDSAYKTLTYSYINANLPTRCQALVSVLPPLE